MHEENCIIFFIRIPSLFVFLLVVWVEDASQDYANSYKQLLERAFLYFFAP